MRLLIVRHAKAKSRHKFAATGKDDALRPLTTKGTTRMTRAARGLRSLVPSIDLIASSPLVRAVETARIIAAEYGHDALVERDELAPDARPDQLLRWLASQRDASTICVVGHEPHLSEVFDFVLARGAPRPSKVGKGSAGLVEFEGQPRKHAGALRWHYSSKELEGRSAAKRDE